MGKKYKEITAELETFIKKQKLFFVGTATAGGRINVSPKGMDSLRVLERKRIVWLNLTGSGNETAAHVRELNRMTLMFCAFEGSPLILRVYGTARVIHTHDAEWQELNSRFRPLPGARQIFDMQVDLVLTSCGMGVPLFEYAGDREQLIDWAARKGDAGVRKYWEEKNVTSLDGKPTYIMGSSDREA